MACPHVAGAAGLLFGEDPSRSSAEIESLLIADATRDVISNLPNVRTPNLLLYVGSESNAPTPAPPPTPAPTPFQVPDGTWAVFSGDCTISDDGRCATSPNFPSEYPNMAPCVIKVGANLGGINAHEFNTEANYDKLYINGNIYHGTDGPPDGIVPTTDITWSSDQSVTKTGWKLCQSDHTTPAPTAPPTRGPPLDMNRTWSTYWYYYWYWKNHNEPPTPVPTVAPTPVPTCPRGEPREMLYGLSRADCDAQCASGSEWCRHVQWDSSRNGICELYDCTPAHRWEDSVPGYCRFKWSKVWKQRVDLRDEGADADTKCKTRCINTAGCDGFVRSDQGSAKWCSLCTFGADSIGNHNTRRVWVRAP